MSPRFESLEDRTLLTTTEVMLSGGMLTVTDANGADSNDALTISYSGGTYTITDTGGLLLDVSSIAGSTGSGTSTVTVPDTGVTGILFDTLGGDDSVTVYSVQSSLSGNFTITGGTGNDTATINADIATTGTGAINVTVSQNIVLGSGSSLTTVDGGITLSANADGSQDVDVVGIEAVNAVIQTTGTGNIQIAGHGAETGDDTNYMYGVYLRNGTTVSSTASGATAGTITISGTGGDGVASNFGVHLLGSTTDVTSVDGDISITGVGGNGSSDSNGGVLLNSAGIIQSTGTGPDAANITITGTGGDSTSASTGVFFVSGATDVISVDGDVSITGIGGSGSAISDGVYVQQGSTVQVTNGSLSISGTATSGNSNGVVLRTTSAGRLVSIGSGSITVTADGNGTSADFVAGADSIIGDATHAGAGTPATGDITINADSIDWSGSLSVETDGALTIQPRTASTTIGLGGGGGTLNLSDMELAFLQDGFSSITIGDAASGTGAVDIDSSTFSDDLTIAGGSIAVTELDAGTNSVTLTARTGSITDGGDVGTDVTGGVVTLNSAGTIGGGGNAISLAATSLSTDSSTADGAQYLSEADSVSVVNLDAGSGTVTVSGGVFHLSSGTSVDDSTTIDVATDGTLDVNGETETLALVTVSGGSLVGTGTLDAPVTAGSGTVAPGNSPGIIATGDLNLGAASTLQIELNSPYTTAGTDYDQLNVTGSVTIAAGATLSLSGGAMAPAGGESLILIRNDGSDAVNGNFAGLAEGSPVTVGSFSGTITYQGGDGNDVAIVVDGAYSLDGTGSDDSFAVRRVLSGGADLLQTLRGGVVVDSRPTSSVTMITINGQGSDDTLTINYFGSGGFFTTPITFNGNGQTSGDDIVLVSGSVDLVTHQFDNASDGQFTVELGGQSQTTTYTGLEPITDNLSATDRVFTFTGGAETITLSDDGGAGNGLSMIDSTLGESVAFTNPSGSLTINAGDGSDTVNLTRLDSTFDADLTINGDGTSSGGDATVNVNGDISVGSGTVSIGGDGNVSSVSFNGGSLTTTGNVSIAATGAITDGDATIDIMAVGLLLSAGGAIGSTSVDALETTVSNLEVVTSNTVTIDETDDLTIGGVDGGTNGVSSTAVIMITAGGSLTVDEDVTTDAGTFGDLYLTGAVTISSSASVSALDDNVFLTANDDGNDDAVIDGTITTDRDSNIRASRDVLISGLVQTMRSDGDITIQSDFDSDGTGGARITTSGQLLAAGNVDIEGSALSDVVGAPVAVDIENDGANAQIDSGHTVRIYPVSDTLGDASVVINGAIQGTAGNSSIFITSNGDILFGANGDLSISSALAGVGFLGVFADDNMDGSGGISMADGTVFDSGASDIELYAAEAVIIGSLQSGRDIYVETTGAVIDGGDSDVNLQGTRETFLLVGTGAGSAADPLETAISFLSVRTDSGDVAVDNTGDLTITRAIIGEFDDFVDGVIITDLADTDPAGVIQLSTTGTMTLEATVINNAAGDIVLTAVDAASTGQDLILQRYIDPFFISDIDPQISSTGGMITLNVGDDLTMVATSTVSTTGDVVINLDNGDADSGVGTDSTFDGTWTGGSLTVNGNADDDTIDASAISFGATFNGSDGDDSITGTSGNDTITGGTGDDTLNGDAGDDLFLWSDGDGSDMIDGGADSDEIDLVSGTVTSVDYTFASENDGTISVDAQTIMYTNLEPVIDDLDAMDRSFSYIGGTETITLSDDGTVGDGFSMIDSTQGEVVTFAAPTNSLTIDAGDGDDTIDLQGLDATFDADLTINGGDGTDSISAAGDTDVGSGVISIGEASDVESLSFDGGSLITTSDAILVSTGAIADNDGGNDVTASTVALGSGTGVGSAANALDTTINALEADGGTGGVWISNTGDLVVNDIDATLIGVTANGDIELTTSTLMLTFEPLDSNGGNIRLTAVDDIVIVNDVSSDGGDITVNSDSDGTGGGGIYVDGAIVSSSGGNIVLGGGADPTLNPAVATGFLGGQGVTVDAGELNSGTGDISIRGASALSDDAVDFSSVAVATTTSGNITIIGDSTGGDDGVDIDSGSMVSTVSGNITLTGNSTGTADEGIALDDMTITTQTGQITITGTGANGSGIHVGGRSINSVDGDIQLTGTATSNGAVGVDIATGSLSSLVSLSGAQNVDAAAWNLAEIVTIESSTTIPHITINGTGNDTFDVYSFTAGAGDRGIFDIANNSFDTELFLFDSSFNLLDSNDDFDDGDGDGTDSTIDFTFASSGTFYLVVGRYDSSAANGTLRGDTPSTGDTYDLHFSIENHALVGGDDPLPEVEPNDPVLQAGTSAIAATGTGSVTIIGDGDGASAGVRLDGTVGSSSGGVTIQSADDNIEFAASAAVTSVSGMISVSADTMGGNGGQVIMSDGSSVDTSTGLIDVSADGDITLSKLQTTDAVTISSAAGSVIDGGDSDIEITATSTIITAPGGVGTLAGGGADNAIETALDSLSVDTSGGNGDQAINETDALTSLDLNAGTGTVTLVAGGAISDVDGSADITADSASVSASGGIAIATAVTTFAATNDTPGDITVSNSGPLTVGSVSGTVGVSNSAAGGMILIAASSPLTVASDVTASGDITLTSTDSTGTGDDLTIDPGVTVQSTTGNVSLRSGDDVLISAGSIVDAAGVVTIDGDFGDADAGTGSTIDIFGTVNTVGQGIIRGQGDDDVITLDPDATTGPLLIDGQGGDDQYFIQTGSLGGQIDIDDQTGAGNDELNVSGTTNPDAISADASQIVVNTTQVITYTSSLETVNADGGNGADAFDVTPSTTAEINILGSGPAMIPGDMLTYNAPSGATVTFSPTDSDTGTISSTGGVQNVNYDLVEGVKIDGAAGAITLVVNGSSEDDVFNVDFAGGDSGTIDLTLDADGTPGPTTMATVGFTSIQTVQLNGSDGDDILQVTDPADGVSGSLDFNGEGGSDSIVLVSGTATTLTHNFDTAADGSIDIDGAIINYTGLEPITDNIDASNRVFNFAATDDDISLSDLGGGMSRIASLSSSETVDFTNPTTTLTVNGGDGADTIDASTLAFDVTLNGGAGNDSLIGTDGFDQLNGDAGDDTLAGGTSNDTLSGGDDDDLIVWNDGDGSDSVDGNAGTDTLQITASNASGDDVSIDPNGTRFVVTRNNLSLFSLDVGTIETAELNTLGGGDTLTVGDLSGVSDLTTVALNGGDDNDVLDLQGLAGGPVALVDGGDGDDTLLASTGSEGDDGTADDLNLSINGGLGTLDYTVNAILVFQATPSAGADQVIINGSTDDDALTLDFAVDSPLAPGGTFFNGGSEQTGGDNLTLINGTVTTVTHNFANASDGTIEIEEGTTDTITYTGLEPIFDNLSATDRVFNFGATDDVISLSDLGGGLSRIESVSSSETVDFVNPSGSLTINAGDGADTVSASASSLDVTIHGGAGIDYLAGGSGNDAISGEDEPDIIIGSGGNDTLSGGDGEDIFIWEEGDGDDVVNGDADIDRQIVNAADNAAEGDNISVSDNGARIDITRAAGVMLSTFTLDVGTTEIIEVNSLAGDDTIDASALTNAAMDVNAGDGSDTVTGGSQNDTLAGNGGNDVILGGDGDDTLRGGANTDMLNGQSGNDLVEGQGGIGDQLTGETGDDTLDGGASGDDVVIEIADQDFDLNNDRLAGLLTGTDLLIGIELADLTGGAGSNFILAADFDGDTTLRGLDGNDTIIGGSARDTILGGVGDDSIEGHDGNDHIDAGDGSNFVLGGDGNDRIYGGSGNDTLAGEGGNDRVFGLGGDDLMFGGTGSDAMRGGAGRDTLNGEDGPDNLFGQGGSGDVLQGGTGDDNLDGGSGNDRVYESADTDFTLRQEFLIGGTTGTDSLKSIEAAQLEGGASANLINADGWLNYSTLNGGAGNDTVVGSRGGSLINGGNGDDTIIAGRSSDRINGDAGNDNIDAGRGDDIVNGGAGDDLINGNRGADTINGDAGNDRIFGVTNADYPHDPVQPQILETVNNTDNDSLLGGDGDDTIVGGLGSDFVSGGDGANVLDVTSGGDGIDGIDTVSGTMLDAIFQDPTDLLI